MSLLTITTELYTINADSPIYYTEEDNYART